MQVVAYRLSSSDDAPPPRGSGVDPIGRAQPGDDLAYRVEVWDRDAETLDQVLAVTSSASIGYAAFYAATREFPERLIVLKHKNSIMSRWSGPRH